MEAEVTKKFVAFAPTPADLAPLAFDVLAARDRDLTDLARLSAERSGHDLTATRLSFRRVLRRSHQGELGLFVAVAEKRVVAFAKCELSLESGAPAGWYLTGVVVEPAARRRGIGAALVRARLNWLSHRASVCFYVANIHNRASMELHDALGFVPWLESDAFELEGVRFTGGKGRMFRARLWR